MSRKYNRIVVLIVLCSAIMGLGIYAGVSSKIPEKVQLLSPGNTLELLRQYEDDAIVIGEGSEPIYVFIDPLCEVSQMYVQFLYKQKRMLAKYRYYLFLYHLDGKPSELLIPTILESDYAELMLKQVMISKSRFDEVEEADVDVEEQMERIASLAEQIGVYKRPYIIIDGKVRTE